MPKSKKKVSKIFPVETKPGSVLRGSVLRVNDTASLSGSQSVDDKGGKILRKVVVELIFWGSAWKGDPFIVEVTHAIATILTSPYMTELQQYRGILRGCLGDIVVVNSNVGSSNANPPSTFVHADVEKLISDLIKAQKVQDPKSNDQLLYCVIFPTNHRYANPDHPGQILVGEHYSFSMNGVNVHYAWVINDRTLNSMNSIPKVFSHELVEACTNPDVGRGRAAFVIGNQEIGDVCNDKPTDTGFLNGVYMQKYWSQRHRMCILPNQFPNT